MLSSWSDFLSMLAQVAVSLLALLFVSFQIARERWVKKPARRLVAIQTLLEFLTPSFFAIIALLPIEPLSLGSVKISGWQIGGILTSAFGFVVSVVITRYKLISPKSVDGFLKHQLRLQPVAIIAYVLIFAFCVAGTLVWTSVMMVWLLLSGSCETWMFFSELD